MEWSKSDYVMGVGRAGKNLMDSMHIALLFWHCKIPYNDACIYIRNYVEAQKK
jgi:hypothetical protein